MATQNLQSSAEHAGQLPKQQAMMYVALIAPAGHQSLAGFTRSRAGPCILSDCRHRLGAWVLYNSRRFNEVRLRHIHSSGYYTHLQPFCFPNLFLISSSCVHYKDTNPLQTSWWWAISYWSGPSLHLLLTSGQSHLYLSKAKCPDLAEVSLVPALALLNLFLWRAHLPGKRGKAHQLQ